MISDFYAIVGEAITRSQQLKTERGVCLWVKATQRRGDSALVFTRAVKASKRTIGLTSRTLSKMETITMNRNLESLRKLLNIRIEGGRARDKDS